MQLESLETVCSLLSHRERPDLADLLTGALIDFEIFDIGYSETDDFLVQLAHAVVYAPIPDYERLQGLPERDNQRILDAVTEVWPNFYGEDEIAVVGGVLYRIYTESLEDESNFNYILQLLDYLRNIMVAVSTDGPRINDVNAEYREAYHRLTEESELRGMHNPIPYTDLWE